MKKIISNLGIYGMLFLIYSGFANADNHLSKLEFHRTQGVQMGKLSLYFSESQLYGAPQELKGSGANAKLVFSFPATIHSEEIRKKISQINSLVEKNDFVISIAQNKNNIQIAFEFNPSKVGLDVQMFKAIKMEKGINFIFINKEILQRIEGKRDKAVITTAQTKKMHNVMIDCGHGGRDFGTIGFLGKAEKEITLSVGLEVAQLLNQKGYKAGVTRDTDIDVSLDQRTKLANNNADLFLSIHANSSSNKNTKGIETYCLDYELFTPGFSTLNSKNKSYVAYLEKDRCQRSNILAHCVHKNTIETVVKSNNNIDRKVRPAVSQVLLGTDMPAVLIEIGFLSNEIEATLLSDKRYQHLLAQGICNGIISYFNAVKSA